MDETTWDENLILHIRVSDVADEVQTLSFTGVPTGGTFKLEFDGEETADITYAAGLTAATVETALETLSNIDADEATVAGSNGGPFTITFSGQWADVDVPELVVTDEALTGGTTPHAVITESTPGVGDTTISVAAQVECNFGFFHDRNLSIPAGEERFMGPFPRHYVDAQGRIEIKYTSVNGVTIAALVP
jgi:hypothetical protein